MPLKINLKKGQKIILNGAVIENTNPRSVSFTLMNEASILRDNDVLTAEEACTPASRVYFNVQGMYLFPDKREQYYQNVNQFLEDYERAAKSALPITYAIREALLDGEFYSALKQARHLIEHENKVLCNVQESDPELLDYTSGGESDAK
ncbi:MAG: flagellar biosynthesis repressor FlbT [Methylocystaceae bacterium]|nr:flagellar biosynthesis repressor FlbT [Methylocystaceae bacterium]